MDGRLFAQEVTGNVPYLTLTGSGEALVEQHKGLVAYRPDNVVLRSSIGEIGIEGENLTLKKYTREEALICGCIARIVLRPLA